MSSYVQRLQQPYSGDNFIWNILIGFLLSYQNRYTPPRGFWLMTHASETRRHSRLTIINGRAYRNFHKIQKRCHGSETNETAGVHPVRKISKRVPCCHLNWMKAFLGRLLSCNFLPFLLFQFFFAVVTFILLYILFLQLILATSGSTVIRNDVSVLLQICLTTP